jgi:hypothetical protein
MGDFSEQGMEKGGFSRAIGADQEGQFATMEMEIDLLEGFDVAKVDGESFDPGATGIARGRWQGA